MMGLILGTIYFWSSLLIGRKIANDKINVMIIHSKYCSFSDWLKSDELFFDWICWNMATEISLKLLLSIFYRIFTENAVLDTAVDCHELT